MNVSGTSQNTIMCGLLRQDLLYQSFRRLGLRQIESRRLASRAEQAGGKVGVTGANAPIMIMCHNDATRNWATLEVNTAMRLAAALCVRSARLQVEIRS